MSAKNQRRECIYCGEQKKVTEDHVPPKLLLGQPYPRNLITVPACRDCNQSFMKDDEYTRTVVTLDMRAANNDVAREKLQSVIRSLKRPEARRFSESLARRASFSSILGADGSPMGQSVDVDKQRIHNTGLRIMRGLYFAERGTAISKNAGIKIGCKLQLTLSDREGETILNGLRCFPDRRGRDIGGAFSYVAGFGEQMSAWLMVLYGCCVWLGTTDERPTNEREKDVVLVSAS